MFTPSGAVIDDPVGQGPFEADVMAGLFRLNPLVFKDLVPLCLELFIKGRVAEKIVSAGAI